MAFQKKTWKDRITEFPTRRTLTKSDGSTELVTVARAEGTVSQEGDAFNAANMNDLEERINQANNDLNESLTASDGLKFKFGKDGDGNYGYYGADDSLIPFSSINGYSILEYMLKNYSLSRPYSARTWNHETLNLTNGIIFLPCTATNFTTGIYLKHENTITTIQQGYYEYNQAPRAYDFTNITNTTFQYYSGFYLTIYILEID